MQFLLVFVTLYAGVVHSWDIATTAGDDTIYFYTNEVLTGTISIPSRKISSLTYDEVHNIMLYVDKQSGNHAICGYDLTSIEDKCFTTGTGRAIYDIAFDAVTETVFFTDTYAKSIYWFSLKPGSSYSVTFLIKVDNGIPHDIVVDSCKGYIYWLNTGISRPTIERARLDGTGREVFETRTTVPTNTYWTLEPNSLAIDQHLQRIYWMEPGNTTEYHLYTKLLNTPHTPYYIIRVFDPKHMKVPSNTLTVSKDFIFHLEYAYGINAVYAYGKIKTSTNNHPGIDIILKKTVYSERKMPISIVANYKMKDQIQDCEPLNRVKVAMECDGPYCVHGTKAYGQSACTCTPGYTGERCDVSVCDNYCLQGYCSVDSEGLPKCRCTTGHTGERCEVDSCRGYCLNSGECSLNEEDEPSCECAAHYDGVRCETRTQ
ncbi:hypothetical protein PYW07_011642 [Mythimna separata]|uniref:Protein cueball n=1 Tax=Mythimna separata TaxID=271217 RepID=A0AAD8DKD6_MYTSE|nr:hypothetical protein PYW07_011642 [Mythimna separata]